MARRATRLSPKALLRLRQKLVDEGLYEEDRPCLLYTSDAADE